MFWRLGTVILCAILLWPKTTKHMPHGKKISNIQQGNHSLILFHLSLHIKYSTCMMSFFSDYIHHGKILSICFV